MSKAKTKKIRKVVPFLASALVLLGAVGSVRAQVAPAEPVDNGKLTMRHAVTLALQNSRDLALARVQYTVALNQTSLDRAAFLPNVYTGSGAAYTSGFPSLGGSPPAVFR
jgi:outer membrane protein TolC